MAEPGAPGAVLSDSGGVLIRTADPRRILEVFPDVPPTLRDHDHSTDRVPFARTTTAVLR